jgi:hypothetical protein
MKNKISEWIKKNWDKIPDKYKTNIKPDSYSLTVVDLKLEGHIVVLLIDRQKPSISSSYDFNEERIGINRFGEVVWGFDSGCSCPSPWKDSYPGCYNVAKTWKEFKVDGFDPDFLDEAQKKFNEIVKETDGKCPLCGGK